MKQKASFSKISICFVGVVVLTFIFFVVYVFFSHKYVYIKDSSGTEILESKRINKLILKSPSEITLNSLRYCENLDMLSISFVPISKNSGSLYFLQGTHLRELQLIGQWEDYSILQYQEDLESLWLYTYGFNNEDFKYLLKMNKLEELTLVSLQVNDISGIEKLENLQTLDLRNLTINDYSPLFKCDKLETVYAKQLPKDVADALIDKGVEVKAEILYPT